MSRFMSLLAIKSPNGLVIPRSAINGGVFETSWSLTGLANEDSVPLIGLSGFKFLDLVNQGMVIGKENYSWASEKRRCRLRNVLPPLVLRKPIIFGGCFADMS